MAHRTLLMLTFGDSKGDRRARNFKRFFEEHEWSVELIGVQPHRTSGPMMFWEFQRRLLRAVREREADVVFACDLYSLSAARWLKERGRAKKLIYDAREIYTELPAVAMKLTSKMVWRTQERRGLMSTDIVIVTAPQDAQAICDVHSFLPRSVLVRNLPWRDTNIQPDASARTQLGIPADARVLVYVGGLLRGRGLENSVTALGDVTGVHLLIVGAGPLREPMESQAKVVGVHDRVHFTGPLEPEKALSLAAACDAGLALVEPISKSYELALPSKLFEYMMCGIPVISSNLSQVLELFKDEPWMTFVDPSDLSSIAKGIEHALTTSETARAREREISLSEYHFEHDAANLLAVLDKR